MPLSKCYICVTRHYQNGEYYYLPIVSRLGWTDTRGLSTSQWNHASITAMSLLLVNETLESDGRADTLLNVCQHGPQGS